MLLHSVIEIVVLAAPAVKRVGEAIHLREMLFSVVNVIELFLEEISIFQELKKVCSDV